MRSTAALALLACLCAAPALGQPTEKGLMVREADLIARLGRAIAPYTAQIQSAEELALFDVTSAGHAETLLSNGADADQVKAWIADWRGQAELKVQALQSQLDGAPPMSPATLAEYARQSPDAARQVKAFSQTPSLARKAAEQAIDLTHEIETDLASAVPHDPASVRKLAIIALRGIQAQIGAENASMQVSLSGLAENHPQYALLTSVLASNNASLGLLAAAQGQVEGRTFDQTALAASTHGYCNEARTQAGKIAPLAAASRAKLLPIARVSAEMKSRWFKAWDSYQESGEVELAIADQCDKIADQLDAGVGAAQAIRAGDQMEALAQRRVALVMARSAALSQSP